MSNPTPSPSGGSKTPRTDAAVFEIYQSQRPELRMAVPVEDCAKLEIELNTMTADRDVWQQKFSEQLKENSRIRKCLREEWTGEAVDKILTDVDSLSAELTDARATIQAQIVELCAENVTIEGLTAERDTLQKQLAEAEMGFSNALLQLQDDAKTIARCGVQNETLTSERDDLAAAVKEILASARPSKAEHPAMWEAWENARAALPVTTAHVDSSAAPQSSDAPPA